MASDISLTTLETIIKNGELRVGLEPGYMPFEMINKDGDLIGFDIDMAKEIARALNVKFVPVKTVWNELIPALITNKCDIILSGMTITLKRNLKINFSDPYIVIGQTILLNNKHKGKVRSYKDLNYSKYIIVSVNNTTGEQAIKRFIPKCTYKGFIDKTKALKEVLNNKADAYVYDLPDCLAYMAKEGRGKLFFINKPFTYEPLAFGIRKGDIDMINFINNFLRQIKHDGRYEFLYKKWIKSTKWLKDIP